MRLLLKDALFVRAQGSVDPTPTVHDTQSVELLRDRYTVLLREDHPIAARKRSRVLGLNDLSRLEYVAVRSHSETLRILQLLNLDRRLRLTASHFLALPAIVKSTDLGVVMPLEIANNFAADGGYMIIEPRLPLRDFAVSLHWSRRFQADPAQQWMKQLLIELFKER